MFRRHFIVLIWCCNEDWLGFFAVYDTPIHRWIGWVSLLYMITLGGCSYIFYRAIVEELVAVFFIRQQCVCELVRLNIYAWHKINNFVTVYEVKHLTIYGYFACTVVIGYCYVIIICCYILGY